MIKYKKIKPKEDDDLKIRYTNLRILSKEKLNEILNDREEGLSINQISLKHKLSFKRVRKIMKKVESIFNEGWLIGNNIVDKIFEFINEKVLIHEKINKQ